MPYGFYEFVRFIAMIGFVILAFDANQMDRPILETLVYIALAILFQPFFKIALGRELWNIVDVVVGIGLMASVLIRQQNIESK